MKPRHLPWLGAWGLAVYGVLLFGILPLDLGEHELCGPWGCLPPLQALISLHAFWVLVLLPAVVCALSLLSPRVLRWVGGLVMSLGLAGVVFAIGREAMVWLAAVPPEMQRYFPQRVLFVLATLSDYPLLQMVLAGLVCWGVGWQRSIGSRQVAEAEAACQAALGRPGGKPGR